MTVITDNQHYTNIANAIRNKLNTQTTYTPAQMANAISQISTSGGSSGFSGTPTVGDTPVLFVDTTDKINFTDLTASNVSLTIQKNGTYRFKSMVYNTYTKSSYFGKNFTVQFYKNDTAIGETTTLEGITPTILSADIEVSAGDIIKVCGTSANASYAIVIMGMVACINWDNSF
nr:MAG TPA: GITR ligand protein [Caudoviricetes sp.]